MIDPMQIKVRYFSRVRTAVGAEDVELYDLPEGQSLGHLLQQAAARHPGLTPYLPSLLVTRNREWAARDATLSDGDEVGLMPPVNGG